jgi:hypothetical protein
MLRERWNVTALEDARSRFSAANWAISCRPRAILASGGVRGLQTLRIA